MKYQVIWNDCEDDRTGPSFEVEGKTPSEAYYKAEDRIKGMSAYLAEHYWELDIECLVDENGKYLHPDFFLKEDAENEGFWKKVLAAYKEFSYYSSPEYKKILSMPLSSTECLSEEPGGFNTRFEDQEDITYIYGILPATLEDLAKLENPREALGMNGSFQRPYARENEPEETRRKVEEIRKILLAVERGCDKETIGERLEKIVKSGKSATHIVRLRDIYGGDTHYSVYRNRLKAEVYEVQNG